MRGAPISRPAWLTKVRIRWLVGSAVVAGVVVGLSQLDANALLYRLHSVLAG